MKSNGSKIGKIVALSVISGLAVTTFTAPAVFASGGAHNDKPVVIAKQNSSERTLVEPAIPTRDGNIITVTQTPGVNYVFSKRDMKFVDGKATYELEPGERLAIMAGPNKAHKFKDVNIRGWNFEGVDE